MGVGMCHCVLVIMHVVLLLMLRIWAGRQKATMEILQASRTAIMAGVQGRWLEARRTWETAAQSSAQSTRPHP